MNKYILTTLVYAILMLFLAVNYNRLQCKNMGIDRDNSILRSCENKEIKCQTNKGKLVCSFKEK